jgi:hypothetical protein
VSEPIDTDPQADAQELLRRAAQDLANAQAATAAKQAQGGPGNRQGVLPGEGR